MTQGYLLDTSVVSALAPDKPPPSKDFHDWLGRRGDRFFLPSMTVVELEQGVCKLRRAGSIERVGRLSVWVDTLLATFEDRLIPLDAEIARIAGAMSDAATAKGAHPGLADVIIAATAQARGLLLLTRNGRHFDALAVAHADPFLALPK